MPASSRNGVRNPLGPVAPTVAPGVPLASSPGGPSSRAAPSGLRMTLAASAEACWSAWAAPATVAAVLISSPAKARKNRRRPDVDRGLRRGRRRATTASGRLGSAASARHRARSTPLRRAAGSAWDRRRGRSIWGPRCVTVRQYLMTLVTRRPSSRSRPLRNSSSTRNARPTTSPLSRSISSIVPWTVPPVASRSSTISTF